ncbi:hypothetical protein PIB30_033297 [Stylosanthes scabra]|uniref:PB1-like domain-containing protein n=1 Tax=Stylosanthes scabra TaxID=79078 RepID=A0ABU6SCM9_9FABA|nr:hypothetical protein [Stylosanthes scabra]
MENFMVPVFNVGGKPCEDENGVLKYVDGTVHKFEAMDVDLLNIPDLEEMAKSSFGFPVYNAMHWVVPNAANFEFGLRKIKKDSDILELRNSVVDNHCVDFEIYFEHPVFVLIVADDVEVDRVEVNVNAGCVNLDSDVEEESSSHDS